MDDPLNDLPRLSEEALGPCAFCGRTMLQTGLPIFYRFTVQQCGIDASAVRERIALAMMLGGGDTGMALSGAMGGHQKPVVVMSSGERNICMSCAQERTDVLFIAGMAMERGDG